jgi:hypothetical protein
MFTTNLMMKRTTRRSRPTPKKISKDMNKRHVTQTKMKKTRKKEDMSLLRRGNMSRKEKSPNLPSSNRQLVVRAQMMRAKASNSSHQEVVAEADPVKEKAEEVRRTGENPLLIRLRSMLKMMMDSSLWTQGRRHTMMLISGSLVVDITEEEDIGKEEAEVETKVEAAAVQEVETRVGRKAEEKVEQLRSKIQIDHRVDSTEDVDR